MTELEREFSMLIPGDIISFKGKKFIVTEETMEMEDQNDGHITGFSYHLYFKEYKENGDES